CLTLRGVASRTADRAEEFRAVFDLPRSYCSYEELLDDTEIDAVHIVLPNSLHAEWTVRALEKGKHVLCEKPFVTSADDAIQISQMAAQTGLKVMEAFMWRFHPQHQHARKLIREGALGAVSLVRAAFTYPFLDENDIRFDQYLGGGSVFDVGCYPV